MGSITKWSGSAITLLLITAPVAAHHSAAIYDQDRDLSLQGVVTKFKWANPHVYIQVETKNDAGESVEWSIETQTPAGMSREGWSSRSLVPGDKVTITANPARNPDRRMALGHTVLKEDGTVLEIPQLSGRRGPPPVDLPTPIVADSLPGIWATRWNPEVALGFLRARTSWSLTDKGIAAMDSYDSSMNPGNDCVPEPVPYVMIWPTGKSLEIGEELTVIRDELGGERRIYMNADSHEGAVYTVQGHSIGWWEDDVLVLDTTHFANHRRGLSVGGLASGQNKHLIERFALGPDRTTMHYAFRLEDPKYLAGPVTGKLELVYRPDLPFVNEPCDLESARLYLEQ